MSARDPGDALHAALGARLGPLRDVEHSSTPWRSATFAGTRFAFEFTASDDCDHLAFVGAIGDAEIPLRHGFVADVEVVETRALTDGIRFRIEALTIDEK